MVVLIEHHKINNIPLYNEEIINILKDLDLKLDHSKRDLFHNYSFYIFLSLLFFITLLILFYYKKYIKYI
jgi:hypothetical protein